MKDTLNLKRQNHSNEYKKKEGSGQLKKNVQPYTQINGLEWNKGIGTEKIRMWRHRLKNIEREGQGLKRIKRDRKEQKGENRNIDRQEGKKRKWKQWKGKERGKKV